MSKKILIVDDERIIAKALTRAFEKEGFEVDTAADGQVGLDKILKTNPDLVILDILMPKMSGLEVLEKVRKKNIQTPVILMTAYGDANTQAKAKELKVAAYVTKPFENIEDIISLVKTHIT
jgi:DNA-binding response OmpR family regulator